MFYTLDIYVRYKHAECVLFEIIDVDTLKKRTKCFFIYENIM